MTDPIYPKWQILDCSKCKDISDENFKSDRNGRKFSHILESDVGKGEIARYEKFHLFPQSLQKICTADT